MRSVDLKAALDCVGSIAEATARDRAFARHGMASLTRLVASELTHLSICDLASGHRRVVSDIPGAINRHLIAVFDHHFRDNPLVRAHGRNPAAQTRRISDLVPVREFHRTPLFNDYYRPIGLEYAMAVPIHVRGNALVSFVFNRRGRDFSDRDRACMESIRPHLGNLYRLSDEIDGARASWGVPSPAREALRGLPLTAREREVLHCLAGGKTDRDIADILGIGARTVHKHLQRIYETLGVETRTAAVLRAYPR